MKTFSKRLLTMLLAAAMVFSLSGMTTFAADEDTSDGDVSDGDISTYDAGEEPTLNVDGYYEIASEANLIWFADQVNGGNNSINGIVTADGIRVSTSEGFSPIGTSSSGYSGTFDGDGHTITLDINNPDEDYQALFGYTNVAAISNVKVAGSVSGKQYTGGIIGYMNGGSITLCVNSATITSTSNDVGGVVGYISTSSTDKNGFITNCGNDGEITVTASGTSSGRYVGGIAGYTTASGNEYTTISGCYNHADIVAQYDMGGIVGRTGGSLSSLTIESCYNTGNITETGTNGSNSYLSGGLVGCYSKYNDISNAFNMGIVTGGNSTRQQRYVGALVGGGGSGTGGTATFDHAYYMEGTCSYDGEDRYHAPNGSGSFNSSG